MHILLKNLLKESDDDSEESSLKIQFYCDMDGVLVDMDGGFKKIADGMTPKEYEAKHGNNSFWEIVGKHPNFWIDLDPLPDAKVLWKFIKENFTDPKPVILSAGQGSRIAQQKTAWIRKHIDPNVQVIIAPSGVQKPNKIINVPGTVTKHFLLDDTKKNIDAWENKQLFRDAWLHKNAADSINHISNVVLKNK